jgi:hypothetical protein
MAQTVTYVDSWQTRFMQSFVNLTKLNSTTWPAVTTVRYEYNDTSVGGASVPVLTAYYVYDQFAFRTVSLSGLQTVQVAQ